MGFTELLIILVVSFPLIIIPAAAFCRIFVKAGKPWWAALIPFYNYVVLCEIIEMPGWAAIFISLAVIIPVVKDFFLNISGGLKAIGFILYIVSIMFYIASDMELAKRFGKSEAWGFFLICMFYFIGLPILGFGKAEYRKQ